MGRLDCVIAWLVRSILSCWQSEGSEFRLETPECSSKALLKRQQVMHRNVELGLSRDKRPEVLWRGGEGKIIWEGEELHRYDCGVSNGNSFTRELLVQKRGFLMEVGNPGFANPSNAVFDWAVAGAGDNADLRGTSDGKQGLEFKRGVR